MTLTEKIAEFLRLRKRKKQELSVETGSEFFDIGFKVLQTIDIPDLEKPALYESLRRHQSYFEGWQESRFVSVREMQYFIEVAKKMSRPHEVIDIKTAHGLIDNLKLMIDKYEQQDGVKPIIFIKAYDEAMLVEKDPQGRFDSGMRYLSEREGWSVFIQGDGRYGLTGSISGSSSTSELAGKEKHENR